MSKNLGSGSQISTAKPHRATSLVLGSDTGVEPILVGWMRKESEQAAGLFLLYRFLAFVTETDCQNELGKLEIDW